MQPTILLPPPEVASAVLFTALYSTFQVRCQIPEKLLVVLEEDLPYSRETSAAYGVTLGPAVRTAKPVWTSITVELRTLKGKG